MDNSTIRCSKAAPADFDEIMCHARSFDLDCEEASFQQFEIVKDGNRILAFGRIIQHPEFAELATVGVVEEMQGQGIGKFLVTEMCKHVKGDLLLVTVLPNFFSKLGFVKVKEDYPVFKKKIDFCKDFHFKDEEIHVMKFYSNNR